MRVPQIFSLETTQIGLQPNTKARRENLSNHVWVSKGPLAILLAMCCVVLFWYTKLLVFWKQNTHPTSDACQIFQYWKWTCCTTQLFTTYELLKVVKCLYVLKTNVMWKVLTFLMENQTHTQHSTMCSTIICVLGWKFIVYGSIFQQFEEDTVPSS